MESLPFPVCESNSFPPRDGFLVKCPTCFKTLSPRPFERFFQTLPEQDRLYTDPIGFTAMPIGIDGHRGIVCGVRVEGFYDRKRTKGKICSDFNPVFPLETFLDTLTKFRAAASAPRSKAGCYTEERESKEFVSFTMHEIRKLNLQIKSQAEEMIVNLGKGPTDRNFLDYRAQNVFATSSLISTRLDAYDFHINPNVFASGPKVPIPVYKKFEKTKHSLEVASRKHRKKIKLVGQSFHSIFGYQVFELLPFVLLENAIKYSPEDQEVTVVFNAIADHLEVVVESLGPMLLADENERVFGQRFRGYYAKDVMDGTGTGLHFAKLVCDLHKIVISVESERRELLNLNGVPYSTFRVRLQF